jgi:hypothetical protein
MHNCPILSPILRLGLSTSMRTRRAVALRLALRFLVCPRSLLWVILAKSFSFTRVGFWALERFLNLVLYFLVFCGIFAYVY